MARWRICDDDWFWFIPFETDEVDPQQKERNEKAGVETWSQMNLWRCRHCAAMVPGDGRLDHQNFHKSLVRMSVRLSNLGAWMEETELS